MANKVIYRFGNPDLDVYLLGPMNKNITLLEKELQTKIIVTRDEIMMNEENSEYVASVFDVFKYLFEHNIILKEKDIISIMQMVKEYPIEKVKQFFAKPMVFVNTYDGRSITAKTINQKVYFDVLQKFDIVFATGAAGSGKTYLGVSYALSQLKKNKVKKIIITRPVVEAGEKLGFLPGDLKEKIDPYLIPIYDAINDVLGIDQTNKLIEKGVIEIAPLAYMRGRTLDNAFIILDEAQNTTISQMKMFLTRLGFNSKMLITGDFTQIDLPNSTKSGLMNALEILKGLEDIGFVTFTTIDVMRHPLVSEIIRKYEGQ